MIKVSPILNEINNFSLSWKLLREQQQHNFLDMIHKAFSIGGFIFQKTKIRLTTRIQFCTPFKFNAESQAEKTNLADKYPSRFYWLVNSSFTRIVTCFNENRNHQRRHVIKIGSLSHTLTFMMTVIKRKKNSFLWEFYEGLKWDRT